MAGEKITEYRLLTGAQKASILMLALGEDGAARLLSMLEEEEIKDISSAMVELGTVKAEFIENLIAEFLDKIGNQSSLSGNYETTEKLLQGALSPEQVAAIMEEIRGPAGRTIWDKLGNVNEVVFANYLKNEYPQTAAVILSKVKADNAARVLAILPQAFALEVMQRMLKMETVQKDILESIEKTMRSEFMSNVARSAKRDTHEILAEIFNNFDRQNEARLMAALEEIVPDSAEKVKSLMFTFDDLEKLSSAAIQEILRQADKEKLPLALKGANERIKDMVFKNLSERASKMLTEDLETLGAVRVRDVEEAQAYLVTLTKDLAERGEIELPGRAGDEEMIY